MTSTDQQGDVDQILQREKAGRLRALHNADNILVVPNAWDVSSARIFEDAGFRVIGTTSAGIAATLGLPDGEVIRRDEMLDVVGRIAAAVALPVTADMEAGYGKTMNEIAETALRVITSGAVGLNLEDSTGVAGGSLTEVSLQVERIRVIREAANEAGVPLVINARTDVYLFAVGEPESRFATAVARANHYREAGADCLFIPGVQDTDEIAALVKEIDGPINILAREGVPDIVELERLGVARVSVGSGPQRATMSLVRRIAEELINQGSYTIFTDDVISHAEVNRFFGKQQ